MGSQAEIVESASLSVHPERNRPPLVGASLYNLGNTCFMNAVLQCITHTVPLLKKLLSNCHNPNCSDMDDFCSFCALRKHVQECILMSGLAIMPKLFAYNLNKISSSFQLGEQQDAHEFLGCFLDSVRNSYLKAFSKDKQLPSFNSDNPVNQVFGGRLRSQLRCCDCGHLSNTYEPLLDLSLEIDDVDCLTDALESFTKAEMIDDPDSRLTCDGCKAKVIMEKQLKIDQAPTVIALHLKRFKTVGLFVDKIPKFVKYPLELDLMPYLSYSKADEQSNYELYAIVVHNGSCGSGHYYCNVRTSSTTWHQMNDALMYLITENVVLDQEAYILFYVKKGIFPWFSSLVESEKLLQPCRGGDGSPSSMLDHEDSDHASSSTAEASCGSPREALEKDKGPTPSASTSPAPSDTPTPHTSPKHLSNNVGLVGSPRGRFLTPPSNRPWDFAMDIFADEQLEEDKENHLISQNYVGSKGTKEVGKCIINAVQSAHLLPLMRQMPSSRRSKLMACLNGSPEPLRKRPFSSKSDQPSRKKQIMTSSHQISASKNRADYRSTSSKSLSPRSIRGLLFDGDTDSFEFSLC
ncbi:Ubiquitin carboxyl-terminal hydrolase 20 [Apostasia shenzhenica]|uniref:Ubiquitin carboxyl-terminal hydrolase 20 n=1 Tax=Apostasia shenzhenica TaxID=1088818 RepID=A0A2I0ACE8_9ASPA|nr:Ubiquitin carboxyl-terminal hydrolase 20 [Apostasia shenzhenica]